MRAVNLLPREEPRRRKAQMTLATQLALVAPFIVAALILGGYMLSSSKANDNRATLEALEQDLAALPKPKPRPKQVQLGALLSQQHTERVSALSSALQSRVAWDRILREISAVLPEDVWLTTLSATSPAVAPPPAPAPPPVETTTTESSDTTTTTAAPPPPPPAPVAAPTAPLSIAGFTYSQEGVARFLSRLAVIPEIQDVKLVSSQKASVSGRDVVQFTITAGVRGPGT